MAQSFAMKNDLVNNFNIDGNKIVQIYNPIEVPEALALQSKQSSGLVFVSVGNLKKRKRVREDPSGPKWASLILIIIT